MLSLVMCVCNEMLISHVHMLLMLISHEELFWLLMHVSLENSVMFNVQSFL